tara:strand:- start:125 stop:604 length:480 start_codon:yes stop_codon:yes gene_type:complete
MCTGLEIAAAAALVGGATSAFGAYSGGKAAKKAADYNSAVQRNNAIMARNKAEFDANRQRSASALQRDQARVAFAKGGVELEGTPLLVLEQSAQVAELDAQSILYGGSISAAGYEAQANLSTIEGANQAQAGVFGAGSTLLTGGATTYTGYKAAGGTYL